MDYQYKLSYPAIARSVKAARRQAGLTQAELAERVDISTNAVAKLETGLMTPSLQTLVNIANVLHLDFNALLSSEDTEHAKSSQDIFLTGLLRELSAKDKDFIIHIINGLKLYQ